MTIELLSLVVFGHHGYLEAERRLGQRFLVDLWVDVDEAAAASDAGRSAPARGTCRVTSPKRSASERRGPRTARSVAGHCHARTEAAPCDPASPSAISRPACSQR